MRKRFVPPHYGRELHQRLRRLTQGSRSVEDYHQELELLLIKAQVEEAPEATMARFQGGLNRELQDRMELQEYEDMDELLHKAILVEQQIKRRSGSRTSYATPSKPPAFREDKPSFRPKEDYQTPSKPRDDKGKSPATSTRSRNVKCFKCQGFGHYANECTNKKVMILLDNGEVVSEDEGAGSESVEEGVDYPVQGELLVTRRALSTQFKADTQDQRENLFHTRCLVQNKVCSLIIDGGSCTNVASQMLVDKLSLLVFAHPKLYSLQWLSEDGELRVSKQVRVPLTIGRYQDEITCDILPMEASHILLGRPWQYDKRAVHDGFSNRHSFVHQGIQITLVPLTPPEVHQDQALLKRRREEAKAAARTMATEETKVSESDLIATSSDLKHALFNQSAMILMVCKELLTVTLDSSPEIPREIEFLLQEYKDVFPEDQPKGLPPIRGIEHQIDFVPGATLPNRPAYRTNPVETKEIQKQVQDLLDKGHIRESLSPCAVSVLLVPKKY